jgi:hypothetical protein
MVKAERNFITQLRTCHGRGRVSTQLVLSHLQGADMATSLSRQKNRGQGQRCTVSGVFWWVGDWHSPNLGEAAVWQFWKLSPRGKCGPCLRGLLWLAELLSLEGGSSRWLWFLAIKMSSDLPFLESKVL